MDKLDLKEIKIKIADRKTIASFLEFLSQAEETLPDDYSSLSAPSNELSAKKFETVELTPAGLVFFPDELNQETIISNVEFEENRLIRTGRENYNICANCGMLNPKELIYCTVCQMEIMNIRAMEFEKKSLKIKVKFPEDNKYILCKICGAFNEKDTFYCKDCSAELKKTEDG